jgi:uncharacterized BrkB/YihY/UPF0761 family membrane protein
VADPPDDVTPAREPDAALSRLDRVRAAMDQARERVQAKRATSPTVAVAFDAFGHDAEAGGSVLAAALGFRVVLFLVPYVGFLLIIARYVSDLFHRDSTQLVSGRGIAALTANGITTAQDWSRGARFAALIVVAYALFLSARSFLKVLRIVHTLVWRVPPSRPRHATRATFVFIGVVTVSIVLSALIDALRYRVLIGAVLALVLYMFVAFAVWWLVSWWLPHGDCDLLGLAPGAIVFAVGGEALHLATVWWFPHAMASKSELYGTIGTALALLFWAYLLGRVMAAGATLNFALWSRRHPGSPPPDFVIALPIVGELLGRVWTRLTLPGVGPRGAGAAVDDSPEA